MKRRTFQMMILRDAFEAIETGMSVDSECFEVAPEKGSSKLKTEQAEPSVIHA